ncbi:MAG TPA: hypothetical protein VFB37_03675 [Steroidobacteraceae bacterium]|nr:hypothetical protein [Steroidobacteraceae bacterium]
MSELKISDEGGRSTGWTWLIVLAMVTLPVLAWFFFIPVAAVALVAACIIGTVGGAARRARAQVREQRKQQMQSAEVALNDYWRPMS